MERSLFSERYSIIKLSSWVGIFYSVLYADLFIMLFFYFRYVFLEGAHQSGQLSSPEYALMKQWFNFSVDKFRKQIIPDLIGIF